MAFIQSPSYQADINAGRSNDVIEEVGGEDFSENVDDVDITEQLRVVSRWISNERLIARLMH